MLKSLQIKQYQKLKFMNFVLLYLKLDSYSTLGGLKHIFLEVKKFSITPLICAK